MRNAPTRKLSRVRTVSEITRLQKKLCAVETRPEVDLIHDELLKMVGFLLDTAGMFEIIKSSAVHGDHILSRLRELAKKVGVE